MDFTTGSSALQPGHAYSMRRHPAILRDVRPDGTLSGRRLAMVMTARPAHRKPHGALYRALRLAAGWLAAAAAGAAIVATAASVPSVAPTAGLPAQLTAASQPAAHSAPHAPRCAFAVHFTVRNHGNLFVRVTGTCNGHAPTADMVSRAELADGLPAWLWIGHYRNSPAGVHSAIVCPGSGDTCVQVNSLDQISTT